jgi:hypothetical protein
MTTTLELCQSACRQLNFDQSLSTLSTAQAFPYNIVLDCLHQVIQYINRKNKHAHMQIAQYVNGNGRSIYSVYDFAPILNPRRVIDIYLESENPRHRLIFVPHSQFQANYSDHETKTGKPDAWTYYGNTLATNVTADKDYGMVWYYQQAVPLPTDEAEVLAWPEHDMDILLKGLMAYLALRTGMEQAGALMGMFDKCVTDYFTAQYKNSNTANQMPRRW